MPRDDAISCRNDVGMVLLKDNLRLETGISSKKRKLTITMIVKMTDSPRPQADSGVTTMPPMVVLTIDNAYTSTIAHGIPRT